MNNGQIGSVENDEILRVLGSEHGIDMELIKKVVKVCNSTSNERQIQKKLDNIIKGYIDGREVS